ncbi:hypothetical protein BFW01_g9915 [Lasiodiplodia theobromae]|nr:hypothetical protein BFW01_g9915 [Lasiodiplodia theobromae]
MPNSRQESQNIDVTLTVSDTGKDVVICLEPQLDFLSTLNGITSPEKKPLVIFIVLHAAEATKLRSDPRIHSSELTVDIITQPQAELASLQVRTTQISKSAHPRSGPAGPANAFDHHTLGFSNTGYARGKLSIQGVEEPELASDASWKHSIQLSHTVKFVRKAALEHTYSSLTEKKWLSILDPDTIPRTLVERHAASTSIHEPPTPNHLRILLADDNRINLSLLTAFMRRYNFDFQEAMNGLQAVETYKRAGGQFDYVLMDLTMPVMDGMAATREIRRHEQREGLPPTVVIALTGLASAAARVDALSSGINFFLTKPVKFQALHQMLKGAAAGGAMGSGLDRTVFFVGFSKTGTQACVE